MQKTEEIGWKGLIELSAAFKAAETCDTESAAYQGFQKLLSIAADPLDPPDAARARAILEDRHGITVTLPAFVVARGEKLREPDEPPPNVIEGWDFKNKRRFGAPPPPPYEPPPPANEGSVA